MCKPGTKPCGCVSLVPANYSCSWRQHLYYGYLLDETGFEKYPFFLQCGDPAAKGLLDVREWE